MPRNFLILLVVGAALGGCAAPTGQTPKGVLHAQGSPAASTWIGTAFVESAHSASSASDGDLWPSCWSDDGNLYAANGDGKGFGSTASDIVLSRVTGTPPNLSGTALASGNALGQVWGGSSYNRKPTGMACAGGKLFLAVQDLNLDFNDAPNATVAQSNDHGLTWTWNRSAPMFSGGKFTTVMFLDYGQNNVNSPDGYVYAYGLDGNWRDSFNDRVPDPVDLYLARVPATQVLTRSAWQFYAGQSGGAPVWTPDINARVSVLHDDRRIYPALYSGNAHNLSVISQGGVVFDKPLNRYLYTSWTEYTFEFYESPTPWGPWTLFMTRDFGGYPWTQTKHGGYATTVPSKFISADGKSLWLQSNVCSCGGGGTSVYDYSLRRFFVEPAKGGTASNPRDDALNLAMNGAGTRPVERVAHFGNVAFYNDGVLNQSEDDWNDENKTQSWWGYVWPQPYTVSEVRYTTGQMFSDGGWFSGNLGVQVRQNGVWVNAAGVSITPPYPYSGAAGPNKTYTLRFTPVSADGVRIIGTPGGSRTFTSIAELGVYHRAVADQGFEEQTGSALGAPWGSEGSGSKGVDRGAGFAHSGANNAWIHTSSADWNAITQVIPVTPGTNYRLTGWVQTSANLTGGYFGVRAGTGSTPLAETSFAGLPGYTLLTVDFNSGTNSTLTVFGGFHGAGADTWLRLDDVRIATR
ncbi:hypothetical protein E5F05_00825 (plasmid) [Deinococcus metallilatus]|uniref:DUF4185 domain-containing protein n=1 Tax=Deinococcus metallilatus TaxID=1211322 RepID=A0AAJ5F7F3_9DEIO|nr:hypothetical protein [Deinococcus metallilatus]MBB5293449.1 hypothetical protein [Deinococcus metallilatus]QBY06536.1 hypothetical protein E5F05_00825 [Deinococcus metallilatus]RXJ17879.1 hypothetical protein ERJ73_00435 [Deinococcus metallilatus]TLK32151.1 DUF4185 domain-containing protein [Deinococcus metallilatus]GMA15331.1 hypothetical protein GCM10025871_16620 [Deinococcus metallilatus]